MRQNLDRALGVNHYPVADWLQVAAQRLGTTPGTVKQMTWGPSNAFQRVRVILLTLSECGQGAVAAGLKRPLDDAMTPQSVRDLRELLHEEQELDGAEDPAQLALLEHLESPAARDTYRKRLLKYRAKLDEILSALDQEPA